MTGLNVPVKKKVERQCKLLNSNMVLLSMFQVCQAHV